MTDTQILDYLSESIERRDVLWPFDLQFGTVLVTANSVRSGDFRAALIEGIQQDIARQVAKVTKKLTD